MLRFYLDLKRKRNLAKETYGISWPIKSRLKNEEKKESLSGKIQVWNNMSPPFQVHRGYCPEKINMILIMF